MFSDTVKTLGPYSNKLMEADIGLQNLDRTSQEEKK